MILRSILETLVGPATEYFLKEIRGAANAGSPEQEFQAHMIALSECTGLPIEDARANWAVFDAEPYTGEAYSVVLVLMGENIVMSAGSRIPFKRGCVPTVARDIMERENQQMPRAKFSLFEPENKPVRVMIAVTMAPSEMTAQNFLAATVELVGSISGLDLILKTAGYSG